VALAVITWVTSTASRQADLPSLAAHGRRMGSLVAVDATQGLGIIPFDVQALAVDFAASTSLKWLCGLPGAGFGYLRAGLLQQADPRHHGWFGKTDPFDWALESFRPALDARRFDTGTPSYIPYIASTPGIEWLLEQGVAALRANNLALSERLIAVAQAHGVALASPRDATRRGGSVMLELPPSVAGAEAVAALARHGLIADHRGQRLRLSPGPCTTEVVEDRLDRAFTQMKLKRL
jgi:selenocysteine lyase/cysteine desulfurase